MNSYKEIKVLYQGTIAFFNFIVFEAILNVFHISYGISAVTLILSVASVFFADYLVLKLKNKNIAFFIPVILSLVVFYIFYQDYYKLYNIVVVVFNVVMINKTSEEFLNYDYYISEIKNKIAILLAADTVILISEFASGINYDRSGVLRLSIIFLILAVVLLRAGRNFSNGISNTRTRKFNIAIAASAFIISIPIISEKLFWVFTMINKGLGILFGYVYVLLLKYILWPIIKYVLAPLFTLIENAFKKLFGGSKFNVQIKTNNGVPKGQKQKYIPPKALVLSPMAEKIMFAIAIFLVLYIAYRIFMKASTNKKIIYDDVVEEREVIKGDNKGKKKKSFRQAIMDLFKGQNNNEKIKNIYKSFQKDTLKKGIFKKYMTASNLRNITSAYVDSKGELTDITEKYNEAKFSSHNMTEESLTSVKEDYNKIKKEL